MQVTCPSGKTRSILRRVVLIAAIGVATSLLATSCATAPGAADAKAGTVWLCRPGSAGDPCADSLSATTVLADGSHRRATWPGSATARRFDCFYVYPTVSLQQTSNTDLSITKAEKDAAIAQAAPFSRDCDLWAPVYRSQTWPTVEKGLGTGRDARSVMRSSFATAYDSVLASWRSFLAHDDRGRPIVLIGDSQGSAILIHLISAELDHEPSLLHRLVAAILVGGNLQVPTGKTVGATFTRVPLCTSDSQTGCAIAFSSFGGTPPTDAEFARPGQGVSLQSGQTTRHGQQVACVDPAALAGGTGTLLPFSLTATQTGLTPSVATPWVAYPDLYSAHCTTKDGATWLQVTRLARRHDTRPVVNDRTLGPAWGYHLGEFSLTLGNLLGDLSHQESAWLAQRGS